MDFDKLGSLIDWQISEGTDAIVICGTTGEAPTLPMEEHKEAIRYTVERVAKRVPVIAGAGSNDTRHAMATSRFAQEAGADALLSVVPYYNQSLIRCMNILHSACHSISPDVSVSHSQKSRCSMMVNIRQCYYMYISYKTVQNNSRSVVH